MITRFLFRSFSVPKPKELLALDCDDVLLDFTTGLCVWHNRTYGTECTREQFVSYNLATIFKCSPEEAGRRLGIYFSSTDQEEIRAVEGAVEGVIALRSKYDLAVVTARPPLVRGITVALLKRCIPHRFEGIYCLGQGYSIFPGNTLSTKGAVCRKIGARYLVDDMMHHAVRAQEHRVPVFLLDTPWNQGEVPDNTRRVRDWDHILEILL